MGKNEDKALDVLGKDVGHDNTRVALHAANALDHIGDKAKGAVDAMKNANGDGYVQRTIRWAMAEIGEKMPAPVRKRKPKRKKK
jgi:hypothetical protein